MSSPGWLDCMLLGGNTCSTNFKLWKSIDKYVVICFFNLIGLFKKKTNKGGGGTICNFQGYQRNSMWMFQRLIKNKVPTRGISRGDDQEKIMWNFQGSWFLALQFLRDVTQFCRISRGGALFCLAFPGLK